MSTNSRPKPNPRSTTRTSKQALQKGLVLAILAPFILLITSAFSWTAPQLDIAGAELPPAAFPPGDVEYSPQPVSNGNLDRAATNGSLWLADVPRFKIGPQSFSSVEPAPVEIPASQQLATAAVFEEITTTEIASGPTAPLTSADIEHVVIISMDGVRPDAIDAIDTPALDRLMAKGAYSRHAQTIDPSFTLPSHTSTLSGVVP